MKSGTVASVALWLSVGVSTVPQAAGVRTAGPGHCSFRNRVITPLSPAALEARNAGDLREAARIDRRIVTRVPYPEAKVFSFEELTSKSGTIVVGTVRTCEGIVAKEEVDTLYGVQVEERLKGAVLTSRQIRVTMPGGLVSFNDGSSAETAVDDFQPPQIGDRLLLFLRPGNPDGDAFVLSAGVWSSFGLGQTGSVNPSYDVPSGRFVTTIGREMTVNQLLDKIRSLVRSGPRLFPRPPD